MRDHRTGPYNGTFANLDVASDNAIGPDPHIVLDHDTSRRMALRSGRGRSLNSVIRSPKHNIGPYQDIVSHGYDTLCCTQLDIAIDRAVIADGELPLVSVEVRHPQRAKVVTDDDVLSSLHNKRRLYVES